MVVELLLDECQEARLESILSLEIVAVPATARASSVREFRRPAGAIAQKVHQIQPDAASEAHRQMDRAGASVDLA
ncbi:hypothetical protein ACRAWD_18175 [Caulobacter segnis]